MAEAARRPSAFQPLYRTVFDNIRVAEFLGLYAVALILAGLGDALLCVDKTVCAWPYVDTWKLHQFVFTYDDLGFAKRALLGSVLGLDDVTSTESPAVRALSVVFLMAFSALLLAFSFSLPRVYRLLMVASPAVFLQAGFDLGRIDQLNYALLLLILLSPWRWAILAAPLMVLAHEGVFLIHLPVLFAGHWLVHGPSRAAAAAFALSAAALAAVLAFGGLDPGLDVGGLYPAMTGSSYAMLSLNLSGNFAFVGERAAWANGFYWTCLVVAAAYAALTFLLLRPMLAGGRLLGSAIYLAAFAPLLLSFVGIDWPRWVACVVVNIFILACVAQAKAGGGSAPGRPSGAVKLGLIAAFAAAVAGPVGDATPLPLIVAIRDFLL
jgi:hypothetical protein